jgi:hypothetical protein
MMAWFLLNYLELKELFDLLMNLTGDDGFSATFRMMLAFKSLR